MATEVASLFARLGLESRGFTSGLDKANTSLTGFSKKIGYTMISLAKFGLAAGAAATAFVATKAISEFADFEKALANVSTLVDTSIISMEDLKDEIMALPAVLGSATELAEGLYQAISAGIEPARAVEFIAEAAKAAKAGLADTFTAVDAGTTILNAFGMQASEATNVFDQMFTAVKEGKTTFEELSATIGRLSPIAAAASVSSEEMFAALATLTKGGFATSEAVSRMATALGAIVKPTKEAKDMAAELGFQFDAQALKSKGLHGFLMDVKQATGGNIQSMAQLFGGMESLSVMLALVGKQSEEFTRILGSMEKASGATEEAFDKQKVTLSAVWETFKNTIGKQAILIGEELAPMLKEIIEKTGAWLEANRDLITDGIKGIITTLTTLIGWIKDFISWIDKSITSIGRWTQKFKDFQDAIGDKVKDFIVNFLGIGSTVKPLGEKIDEMDNRIKKFAKDVENTSPEMTIGFKLGDKKTSVTLFEQLQGFTNMLQGSGEMWKQVVSGSGDVFFSKVSAGGGSMLASAAGIAVMWGELIIQIANAIQALIELPSRIIDAISGLFNAIGDFAKNLVKSLDGLIDSVYNAVIGIGEIWKKLWPKLLKVGPELVRAFYRAIPDLIDAFVESIPIIIDTIIDEVPKITEEIIEMIPVIIQKIVDSIPKIIQAIVDRLPDIIKHFILRIPNIIIAVIEAIPDIIKAIIESIPDIIDALIGSLPDIIKALIKEMPHIAEAFLEALIKASYSQKGLGRIGGTIGETFGGLFGGLGGGLGKVIGDIFHEGGLVPEAHRGLFVGKLRQDERPVIAQTGEEILSRNDPRNVQNLGRGNDVHLHIHGIVTTNDVRSWLSDLLLDNTRYRVGVIYEQQDVATVGIDI